MMAMMIMGEVNQQRIKTNGIWMNIAEKGTGPLVLLLHGFPEFWFGWRHQITDLAKKGYHVVAPDLRGYGDSDSPLSPSSYSVFHIVADLIGLLDHFGQQQAFVVGTDWGAIAGWYLSLLRPDRVKSLFQEAGRAEKAFARYDYVTVMKKLILINKTDLLIAPQGMEIIDYLETPCYCPKWITEEELEVFADKFQESGFTGPLNYYRAIDLNWELLAPWQGSKITVPVKLIVGDKDIGFECGGTREYIQGSVFKSLVPNSEVVILDGHHFIHQERPQEVSNEILSFLSKFSLA
ncbi:uncharacterized protein LOC114315269 isoform X2 [Camellia sinensis]|uniref:uncharacterized protein LOC114315269 isoform X2 n=1 Tax=Camellia sinensis TaxID=4442 RepID=UPI001036A805|nr:uncharacterized protein LOC114315269 isoform X2 [Camellia sinensis]